jgi:hypothetical protein
MLCDVYLEPHDQGAVSEKEAEALTARNLSQNPPHVSE